MSLAVTLQGSQALQLLPALRLRCPGRCIEATALGKPGGQSLRQVGGNTLADAQQFQKTVLSLNSMICSQPGVRWDP